MKEFSTVLKKTKCGGSYWNADLFEGEFQQKKGIRSEKETLGSEKITSVYGETRYL